MAKVKIFGDSCVLISKVLVKDLLNLKKYKPTSLKIIEEKTKDEVFAIDFNSEIISSISKFGLTFNSTTEDGYASLTLPLPTDLINEEKTEFIIDNLGACLLNLNKLEDQINSKLISFNIEMTQINNAIEHIELN